jgi:hypothetical protein
MSALEIIALISLAIIGLIVVIELGVLIVLISALSRLTGAVRDRVDPLVHDTQRILDKADGVATTVRDRTEKVTESVATMTTNVATRIDRTTALLERVIAIPTIALLSAGAGLARGYAAWRKRREARRRRAVPPPRVRTREGASALRRAA